MSKTYVFGDEAEAELEKLAQRSHLSRTSVIRVALANLNKELDLVERNGTIIHREADGTERLWHPTLEPAD